MGRFNFSDAIALNVPTQAQFDASTKAASTAFVQQMLGNLSGLNAIAATTTLTPSLAGRAIIITGASTNYGVTLPSAPTVSAGVSFTLLNATAVSQTINAASGNTIAQSYAVGGLSSLALGAGDTVTLASNGSSGWYVVSGSIVNTTSGQFQSLLSANGYQKLPSGLIVEWGSFTGSASADVAVTFPLQFPTAALSLAMSTVGSGGLYYAGYNSLTKSGFNGCTYSNSTTRASTVALYVALGY